MIDLSDGTMSRLFAPITSDPANPDVFRSQTWDAVPEVMIPLAGEPLSLEQTLDCGQAFRWRPVPSARSDATWEGIVGHHVWRLRLGTEVLFARMAPLAPPADVRAFLQHYFALDLPVRDIQEGIGQAHPRAAEAVSLFRGLRILRQDPLETLLTFAIATATNVPRVTRSVDAVCSHFGQPLAEIEGIRYHDFPAPTQILSAPTAELFGPCNLAYRARSIQAIAAALLDRPADWLARLASSTYPDVHRALDALPFYGPKVSDCACLFGFGFGEAVPVDVHVWAIAHELFGTDIPTRTLTEKTYRSIGERFRSIFGPWAGWAQQYLFCARRATPIRERFRPHVPRTPRASA